MRQWVGTVCFLILGAFFHSSLTCFVSRRRLFLLSAGELLITSAHCFRWRPGTGFLWLVLGISLLSVGLQYPCSFFDLFIQCLLKPLRCCFFSWQDSDGNSQKCIRAMFGERDDVRVWAGLILKGGNLRPPGTGIYVLNL